MSVPAYAVARARHAAEVRKRREAEVFDALDFLIRGDDGGRHAEKCVHTAAGEPCSRNYDPLPYPEAMPADPHTYRGTGVGALYGLGMETESGRSLAPDLAGWNLTPRSTR